MKLSQLLSEKRDAIVDRWFDAVVATYPSDSSDHLKGGKDRFHNPVGHSLRRDLPTLLDGLTGEAETDALVKAIEETVRVRTVQCSKPSEAVAWVFALKKIVRQELGQATATDDAAEGLAELDERIDGLALTLCDEYLRCTEMIGEIRVREAQRRTAVLVEQVNKLYGGVEGKRSDDVEERNDAGNL